MRAETQRKQPRVDYASPVHLHWMGRDEPLPARSLNLGPSGVLVEASESCDVGTEVQCDIHLPGGLRRLKGRVVRLESLPARGVALGIAFDEVGDIERRMLRDLVRRSSDQARLVEVRFAGMPEPVRSHAVLLDDGIRVSTPLSFVRIDERADVAFVSGDTRVSARGVVRDVHLDRSSVDGVPRLLVDLALGEDAAAEVRQTLTTAEPAAQRDKPLPLTNPKRRRTDPKDATPTDQPIATSSRRRRGWLVPAALAAAGVAVARHELALKQIGGKLDELLKRQQQAPRTPGPIARKLHQAPAAAPPVPLPSPPVVAKPDAAVAREAAARVVAPPPLPPGTPGPLVSVDAGDAVAQVSVNGSTRGVSRYFLSHPRGLLVNLPNAQATIPEGVHMLRRRGFRLVWVRTRPEGGVQLRFIFANPPPAEERVSLEVNGQAVRVRLHAAVAAPDGQAPDSATDGSPAGAPDSAADGDADHAPPGSSDPSP